MFKFPKKIIPLFLALIICVMSTSCKRTTAPAGHVVAIVKADKTIEVIQNGGYCAWGRDKLYFISKQIVRESENMKILCADDVNMKVDTKWVGKFDTSDEDNVKEILATVKPTSKLNGVATIVPEEYYRVVISDLSRSQSRDTISPYVTDTIPSNRKKIKEDLASNVIRDINNLKFPIITTTFLVSNLDYEEETQKKRTNIKNAELDDLEQAAIAKANVAQAKRDAELAREKGKAKVENAKAEATSNKILNASLTPAILTMEQFKVFKEMAQGPNNQTFVLPYKALGSDVLTQTLLNQRK